MTSTMTISTSDEHYTARLLAAMPGTIAELSVTTGIPEHIVHNAVHGLRRRGTVERIGTTASKANRACGVFDVVREQTANDNPDNPWYNSWYSRKKT